jgi:hypothetical protein
MEKVANLLGVNRTSLPEGTMMPIRLKTSMTHVFLHHPLLVNFGTTLAGNLTPCKLDPQSWIDPDTTSKPTLLKCKSRIVV